MKILSKLARKEGEVIQLDDCEYTFKQDAVGRHYLEVEDATHCERLLGISEGFGLYPDDGQPVRKNAGKPGKKAESDPPPPPPPPPGGGAGNGESDPPPPPATEPTD